VSAFVRELPGAPDPVDACARFLDRPYPILLESALRSERLGRYSFLSADPWLVLKGKGTAVDPFLELEEQLARFPADPIPGLPPFQGGAAGYLGYDLCHHLERLPSPRFDDLALPDVCLGLYDWTLAFDHVQGRAWLVSTGLPEQGQAREERARWRADEVLARLRSAPAPPPVRAGGRPGGTPTHAVPELAGGVLSTFTREAFVDAVSRAREYVLAGDVFQVNLSQRLEADLRDDPFALYGRLRERNAAPFAAYFDCGEAAVVSASPERFLSLQGRAVETRPIKGTTTRGQNPRHDGALGDLLFESAKDRAENVMIVDLLRNDLSKVCEDGSVEVPELCRVERYATVQHLVSTVTGRLRREHGVVDLLRAAWPGGSITGAPKVRAMEIIAELEPTRRGVYTGSLGYLSFSGAMDTSIAIRTFVVTRGRAFFQAGAGIVADSDPEGEYRETLHKAQGMVAAL
jgi:para-aminobenzoate synthetase component 1